MTRAADLVSGFGRLATLRFVILLACLFPTTFAFGHEVRPAYLELKEESPGLFNVLFKTPMRGDARLALDVSFSGRVQKATPVISRMTDDAMVQTWRLSTVESLAGQELRIDGLSNTMTDALVRIEFADGREWIERLTPGTPGAIIPAGQSGWMVVVTYLKLGVEHIILGVDHLLFEVRDRDGEVVVDLVAVVRSGVRRARLHGLDRADAVLVVDAAAVADAEIGIEQYGGRGAIDAHRERLHAVRAGVGISFLPEWLVDDDLAEGRMVRLVPDYATPPVTLFAVYASRQYMAPKLRSFIDFVVAAFS
jgi:DNA-binding transcriptional LysR family regulator